MMSKVESKFTREALSNHKVNDDGNLDVLTDKGEHIFTLIHPRYKPSQLQFRIDEFKANLRLFQYASNTFDALEEITSSLKLLKEGKLSIFNFPIHEAIKRGESALKRASQID